MRRSNEDIYCINCMAEFNMSGEVRKDDKNKSIIRKGKNMLQNS